VEIAGRRCKTASAGRHFKLEDCKTDVDAVDGSSAGIAMCHHCGVGEEPSMEEITTIGLDIAKSVFQVHAVSAAGMVKARRPL
jgi:hypothetical protein